MHSCFFRPEQTFQQTVVMPLIWDALTLMWHQCDVLEHALCLMNCPPKQWSIDGGKREQLPSRHNYHKTSNTRHLSRQYNCRSLRCSWSIACRRCSNYIFILDLTLASGDSAKTAARQYDNLLSVRIWCVLYERLDGNPLCAWTLQYCSTDISGKINRVTLIFVNNATREKC